MLVDLENPLQGNRVVPYVQGIQEFHPSQAFSLQIKIVVLD
jgi:hypothetical protein